MFGTIEFRNLLVPKMHEDTLSAVFSALADPTRRAILERLARGDASVTELAQPFDMTVRAISKHVAILERAGADGCRNTNGKAIRRGSA